jgi:Glycosyl transferase family 2
MTMTRDEADMLPRWLDYYGRQFGTDSLFVIDDGSTDGSTDALPCTVLRLPPAPWKESWMQTRTDLVNGLSRGLLACFDVVIFSDVDEFLVPDPQRYADLPAYVNAHPDEPVLAPVAVNLVHHVTAEPALDPRRPVLAQRRFVKFVPAMCKPLVKRVAAPWMMGFHGIKASYRIDPDLLLVHLKYYDRDALAGVAEARRELHEKHGRGAAGSSWSLGAKEIQKQMAGWVGGGTGEGVPELEPAEVDVSRVVRTLPNGFFRSSGRQLVAMEGNPLMVLPERFRTAV